MKIITGDLLNMAMNGDFDVIIHGCNCFHNFGAGIALQILNRFPEAHQEDMKTVGGDEKKLGTFSKATIVRNGKLFVIVNAYTQYGASARYRQVDYEALYSVFEKIAIRYDTLRIGYPKIGAGLAGGDWDIISLMIDKTLREQDHTLVLWDKEHGIS